MVSMLISRFGGPGLSLGWGHYVVSLNKTLHITLKVPLSSEASKRVLVNLMLGVALRWTSIPYREN